jgi:3-isopropylmalate/(R)-2-methylmalate dehydratase large subunit
VLAACPDLADNPQWRADALALWSTLHSDEDAQFDVEHAFDATVLAPYVTWGTSPDQAVSVLERIPSPLTQDANTALATSQALRYTGLAAETPVAGLPITHVFIGSCTNGRIEDLREVVQVIGQNKVAPGVRAMVVPGSGAVREQAEAEGIAQQLIAAGFEWRKPGCSMCLAMNDDVL